MARTEMELSARRLPRETLDILLAVEDPRFFSHSGVDLRTPGAGLTTITQALAKGLYFERFSPGLAKIKQSLLALVLDRRCDKWTQLDLFINSVYLGTDGAGRPVEGLAAGARTYFAKDFDQLARSELLALVAMIVGPERFNIERNPAANALRVRRIERLLAGECRPRGIRDVFYEDCGA